MDEVVRESVDREREKLEDLLSRVLGEHKEQSITWLKMLGFFSKRGKVQGYNEIQISPRKESTIVTSKQKAEQGPSEKEEREKLKTKHLKKVKDTLVYKERLVPK